MISEISLSDDDRYIWKHELEDFVPKRVFDGHSHLYDPRFLSQEDVSGWSLLNKWPVMGTSDLRSLSAVLFPKREIRFLVTGSPKKGCDTVGMNDWVGQQIVADAGLVGLMLVRPDMNTGEIEKELDRNAWYGFKPYMCFAKREDLFQSTVLDMLPEHFWKIADERRLIVLLHLGRHLAMTDPENQRQIRELCERYPNVSLLLAHCGRCFTPKIAEEGLHKVVDLPNCHVDTSAVCETEVFHILFDIWPLERIIFGTDNPVAFVRGRYVSFGRGWYGIYEDNTTAFQSEHVPFRPTYIAYENLCALKYAIRRQRWGKQEIEDLFWNNAMRLIGVG